MSVRPQAPASTLSTCRNHHLAGSRAATDAVDRWRSQNEGAPLGELQDRRATDLEPFRLEAVAEGPTA